MLLYISGENPAVLKETISDFFTKKLHLVVTTFACGMSIDCPNVRQVIHVGPPDDIEHYIQETRQKAVSSCDSDVQHDMDVKLWHYVNVYRHNTLFLILYVTSTMCTYMYMYM